MLSSIFGGSGNAQDIYGASEQKILDAIKAAQAQGRTDIADSLKKSMGMNQPYMQAGTDAMSAYLNSLGIGDKGAAGQSSLMQQFQSSPGYTYAVNEATNAARRRAAASGQGMSGAEMRGISAQTQGIANQDWSNWLNNYQGRLSNIAGMGQASASHQSGLEAQGGMGLANLGLNYTKMSTEEMQAAAKAKAEAEMSKGNWLGSMGSLLGGVGGFMFGGPAGAAAGSQGGKGAMDWLSKLFQ